MALTARCRQGVAHVRADASAHAWGQSPSDHQTSKQGKAMCGSLVNVLSARSVVVHWTVNQVIRDVRSVTMRWEGKVSQWGCRPGSSGG